MPHYELMFDRDFIKACDLGGKEVSVTIARVVAGDLIGTSGKKTKKPVLYMEGKEKGFVLNKTNCKTIATKFGPDTDKWIGQTIVLYPTQTDMAGETVECIRVRK